VILTSTAFTHHGEISLLYTCEGEDMSPPLAWKGIPESTKSLVLIVDDPDAPDPKAPKMTWVHWLLYNIPPNVDHLNENLKSSDLPLGTLEGVNSWKRSGYGGPCPPIGRHRYFHKLYALNAILPDLKLPTKEKLEAQMEGLVVASTEIVGTYEASK
jgi:Raf kinase inhibitor-like YbhB/YbcL family protein